MLGCVVVLSLGYNLPVICPAGVQTQGEEMCHSVLFAVLGLSLGLVSAFPSQEPENGKNWVVIVAGSNGWYNYRHQVRGNECDSLH